MKRFFLIISVVIFYTSALHAEDSNFKLTFGSNLGNIPFEINKINKKAISLPGIKINSWILSPKFSSFQKEKEISNFLENKNSKDSIYLKINFKF